MNLLARPDFDRALDGLPASIGLRSDVNLSRMNTWRTGGMAWAVAEPKTEADLKLLLERAFTAQIPTSILGWGSNTWIPDEGFPGLVIRTKSFEVKTQWQGCILHAGAGVGATRLLKEAADHGMMGLECIVGVPGSLGGMIVMNAGTHLGEIGARVREVRVLDFSDGSISVRTLTPQKQDWHYRGNDFLTSSCIVTQAQLVLERGDPEQIRFNLKDLLERRKKTQPIDAPSCGSTYRNPEGIDQKAWQLIDGAGLRGHRIGGAQVSEKHSNFLINTGGATSADLLALMQHIEAEVENKYGVKLMREVRPLRTVLPVVGSSLW